MGFDTAWADGVFEGPAWLEERRRDAARAFASSPLPTEREESFRYGRIDELDLARFAGFAGVASIDRMAGAELLALIGPAAATVRTLDGVVVEMTLGEGGGSSGLALSRLHARDSAPTGFGDLLEETQESFSHLAEALTRDAVVIEVQAGSVVELPIVVVHEISEVAANSAVVPRTFVRLGRAAEATVIEHFVSGAV